MTYAYHVDLEAHNANGKKTYSITEKLDHYVKERVESGEYATDSENLRELIRRDQSDNQ